jgi:hypothetical protein
VSGTPRHSIGTPIEISKSEAFFILKDSKIAPLSLIGPEYRSTPRRTAATGKMPVPRWSVIRHVHLKAMEFA